MYLCNSLPAAGKDYSLLHQAPIVALFVLDHIGLPHPSLFEVDNQLVPRKFPLLTIVSFAVCMYVRAYVHDVEYLCRKFIIIFCIIEQILL